MPGLSTYGATKAALQAWNDALRIEMKQYNVQVVNFIPGSLVMCTNITARQEQYATEMLTAFSDEQLEFYGEYYDRYMNYLKIISGTKPVQVISDGNLFRQFRNSILDYTPRATYKCEPLRYVFIHLKFITISKYRTMHSNWTLIGKLCCYSLPNFSDMPFIIIYLKLHPLS